MPMQRRWIQVSKMEKYKIWRLDSNPLRMDSNPCFRKLKNRNPKEWILIPQGMDSNPISSVFRKCLGEDQIQIPHTSDSNSNFSKIFWRHRFEYLKNRIRILIPLGFEEGEIWPTNSNPLCNNSKITRIMASFLRSTHS